MDTPYTDAIGDAGEAYIKAKAYKGEHHLPALFRWHELWDAMRKASCSGLTTEQINEANDNPLCDRLNEIHRICCRSDLSLQQKVCEIEELSDGFGKIPTL